MVPPLQATLRRRRIKVALNKRGYSFMRRQLLYGFVISVTSLFCCAFASTGRDAKASIDAILGKFPGYHLLTLKERDSDTSAYILQHFPKASTSVVHADFDGDGHLDYAVLLKNDKSKETKLFVLLCSEDASCRNVYELDVTAYSDLVYLRPVKKVAAVSQTEAVGSKGASQANLKSAGIQVVYFEKGKVVLYWDKRLKKIKEVQAED